MCDNMNSFAYQLSQPVLVQFLQIKVLRYLTYATYNNTRVHTTMDDDQPLCVTLGKGSFLTING